MAAVNDVVRRLNADSTYTVGFVESVAGSAATALIVVRPIAKIDAAGTYERVNDPAAAPITALASAFSKIA